MKQETLPQFGTKEFNDSASQYFGGKQETLEEVKDLAYYRANAEEDYLQVPISVLRYISELEERSYSETEVLQLLLRLQQTESYNNLYEWFEQNKKK
jgi:hypothetical protein